MINTQTNDMKSINEFSKMTLDQLYDIENACIDTNAGHSTLHIVQELIAQKTYKIQDSKRVFTEERAKQADVDRNEIAIDYHESGQYDYDKSLDDLHEQEFLALNNQIQND